MQDQTPPSTRGSSFHRSIGLFTGTAINMTQMCGIGPFITIPIMVATMGGPQAVIGWIVGALLAVADGMVWAELGAAMPGSGGTYVYLREAFQYRTGKLMPFLFIWTVLLTIPLLMSTGIIGMVEYLRLLLPAPGLVAGAPDQPGRDRPGHTAAVPAHRIDPRDHHRAVGDHAALGHRRVGSGLFGFPCELRLQLSRRHASAASSSWASARA